MPPRSMNIDRGIVESCWLVTANCLKNRSAVIFFLVSALMFLVFFKGFQTNEELSKQIQAYLLEQNQIPQHIHDHMQKKEHPFLKTDLKRGEPQSTINTTLSLEEDLKERKLLYEKGCAKKKNAGTISGIFLYSPAKLAVCHVHKAGCTFWKRVFRFLYKDYDETKVKTMWDIDRYTVHFGGAKNFKIYGYQLENDKKMIDEATKVMFTRDPYTRLWSAYVDKFLLPDSWSDHGRSIINMRKTKQKCPDDIKFEEFLQYTFRSHDVHWRPITDVCDPCRFKPDVLGHVETFSRDSKYVLESHGLGYLMEGYDHSNHVEDEIEILTDYIFQIYENRAVVRECLTMDQLAERLWKVFQINGYFRAKNEFPEDKIVAAINGLKPQDAKVKVIKIFVDAYRADPTTKEDWVTLRREHLVDAFRHTSTTIRAKLRDRFQRDFDLFGYGPDPPGFEKDQ